MSFTRRYSSIVAILVAGLCGAVVASIPAALKMKWDVSEVVTSIMLNYVVQFLPFIWLVTIFEKRKVPA